MRNKRWLEQARSLWDESDLLESLLRSIMEVEIATKRILNLIARVDVEFAAIFAAARDERHGVGRQPELLRPLACFCEVPHDALKLNIRHLQRWNGEQHDDAPFVLVSRLSTCRHGSPLNITTEIGRAQYPAVGKWSLMMSLPSMSAHGGSRRAELQWHQ